MHRLARLGSLTVALSTPLAASIAAFCGCSSTTKGPPATLSDSGGVTADTNVPGQDAVIDDTSLGSLDGGPSFEVGPGPDAPPAVGPSIIYATTDTALYQMDPSTKAVTLIGNFSGALSSTDSVTDVAVNGAGALFVNTETDLYSVALPSGGAGDVVATHISTISASSSTQKFFALGFTPSGVLETGIESLVAGDNQGNLYLIPNATTATSPTPVALGGFGPWVSGDPEGTPPYKNDTPDHWELSGDIVFYTDASGNVQGLATLCLAWADDYKDSGVSYICEKDNDVLAEIDMTALATKSASANLRKGFYGAGTHFGRVFGLGAWESNVYGFNLAEAANDAGPAIAAQLVSIDSTTGLGTSVQSFASISDGWTGAGVSTKAVITVPPPKVN